jgi:site-specific DNA-methyltransferase (adenine-specific)
MQVTDKIKITNEDNMELMARYTDNYFNLAIVDPPYGIGIDGQKKSINKNPKHNRKEHTQKNWDNAIPSKEYFYELKRVSKNQIIWGGNYFTEYLEPTKAWIFWYKGQNDLTMSDGEMAWTSFETVTRQFKLNRAALIAQNTFHPTEKPYKLYKWLLDKYAKQGDKILDTHLGSGSIAIACHDYGFDLTACELDIEYYEKAIQRIKNYTSQQKLF